MGGEEIKRHQPTHNQLMSPQRPFSTYSTDNANDKSTNLRKNGIYRYSDVVTTSVYSEKTCMKKLMMIMI